MKNSTIKTRFAALLITMVMLVGTAPAIASQGHPILHCPKQQNEA